MSGSVEEALANCLERLEAGEVTPEEAASLYPELRAELEPLLNLAAELRAMPRVEAPASLRGYKRSAFRRAPARQAWWRRLLPAGGRPLGWAAPLAQAAAVLVILFLAAGGTAVASASSLPDEPLYPVKLAVENAQLALAPTDQARAELELHFAAKRLAEIETAAQQGRPDAVAKAADLYREKVDAAVKVTEASSDSSASEVENTVRQNQDALAKVLAKVENPKAKSAIERAMVASSKPVGSKEENGEKGNKPNEVVATATPAPASAQASATPTATPTATPSPAAPADTHEPPGKAKGHAEQPGNSGQVNPHGQEPRGQGQVSKQAAPVQEAPEPTDTAVPTVTPVPPSAHGSEMGNGNGPQKPVKDSDSTNPDGKGQKKGIDKEVQKNDFLGSLLDSIQSLVTRRR